MLLSNLHKKKQKELDDIESGTPTSASQLVKAVHSGGTFETLVEELTAPDTGNNAVEAQNYLEVFIGTYHTFTTAPVLLDAIIHRFSMENPKPQCTREELEEFVTFSRLKIRLRVFEVLKHWIEKRYIDFINDPALMKNFVNFVNIKMSADLSEAASQLKLSLEQKKYRGDSVRMTVDIDFKNIPKPIIPKRLPYDPKFSLLDWDSEEIARQLTIMDYAFLKKIEYSELFNISWKSTDKVQKAPNILSSIHNFNRLSLWFMTEIVKQRDTQQRVNILTHVIKIGMAFYDLHNFNGLMQIFACLTLGPVTRLKKHGIFYLKNY